MKQEILQTISEIIKSLGINTDVKSIEDAIKEISDATGIPENVIVALVENGLLSINNLVENENDNCSNVEELDEEEKIDLSIEELFDVMDPLTDIDTALEIVFEDESKLHKVGHFESIEKDCKFINEQFILETEDFDYEIEFIREFSEVEPEGSHFMIEVTEDMYKIMEVIETENGYITFILSVSK